MNLPHCPSVRCSLPPSGPIPRRIIRAGFYRNRIARSWIQRYRCLNCRSYFSSQTLSATYRQKRPDLNTRVRDLLCSQVSQRRCAIILGISSRTVVRKFRFMARQAAIENGNRREELRKVPVREFQFDDLITSIHTKCKPASVSLAVHAQTREILGFQVSILPARHPLAEISLKKYGPRKDERPLGLQRLFQGLVGIVTEDVFVKSDCDPEYPKWVSRYLPHARYERVKARRGRSGGFGELKRIGFDPIFSLNHTCAMLRANLNRLARRTWCTTKTWIGLVFHLELYAHFHNSKLIPKNAV